MTARTKLIGCLALLTLASSLTIEPASGYVEVPYALGRLVNESSNILVIRVESVDKAKNLIVFRKVRDIKGTHKGDVIQHNIGRAGFHPREWQNIMAWAAVGRTAMFFHNGGAGEVCIDKYWYQCYAGAWWRMSHAEPYLLRSFAGKLEKLAGIVATMLTGQEVVVPCMVDGNKQALQLRTARLQRMRASVKISDYNPKRDFVGWGVEEFQPIAGMGGFTHYAPLDCVGPGAAGIAAADFDGDGKGDLCLYGAARVVLLRNTGGSLSEVPLGLKCGARAAAWADANADGKPDLLLATPEGPKLFINDGKAFKDASASLPVGGYCNTTAAAWIDCDGDGRPDVLLADGFRGLRLLRNRGGDFAFYFAAKAPAAMAAAMFEDISEKAGLGERGVGGSFKGDHLAVADVNGDGRQDFLYSASAGVLAINTPKGFVESTGSGVAYLAGKVAPAFGDFNGDGRVDLFVPQPVASKLFAGDGKGRFADVTAKTGALAGPIPGASSAAWTDLHGSGRPDLIVGCLRGPNRCFRNNGDGTFTDVGDEIGLDRRIFNTRGIAVLDINTDGVPDVVFNNEGQASAALLGNPAWPASGGMKP